MSKAIEVSPGRASAVRVMFDSIAPRYDALNRFLSFGIDRYWRRCAVAAVLRGGPREVLDLACGTGDMTRMLLKRSAACVRVYAVDSSHQMLLRARAKPWPRPMRNRVHFIESSAERLPLESGCVDAVMVSFGVRNFTDRGKALQEMHRVLRPGGEMVVLEFSTPRGLLFGRMYGFYFHHCLPLIGRIVSGSEWAYRYLPQSVDAFPEGDAFLQEVREAGFFDGKSTRMTGGIASLYIAKK